MGPDPSVEASPNGSRQARCGAPPSIPPHLERQPAQRHITASLDMTSARLFPLDGAKIADPEVHKWFAQQPQELRSEALKWFRFMRSCGTDVLELLHDGHPTACIAGVALGDVNAFKDHVNVGFFLGSTLSDPAGLLEGSGRFMRHVKVRPGVASNEAALRDLISRAYADLKDRLPKPWEPLARIERQAARQAGARRTRCDTSGWKAQDTGDE